MAFDLGAIIAHIKADTSEFKKGLDNAKSEAGNFKQTLGSVGDSVVDFGKKAAIMTGAVAAGVGLVAKLGLESAAKFEQYQIAFTTLLKDEKKAAEAIKNIQEDAAKTPFELAPLVAANQRLISAGINAQDARKDIINLGNAISATGGGGAELERLSTNLQQIKAVGKASALDIKQFAFAGINVYQLLADSTGKSVEQVREMEVSYQDLSKAFEKASAKGGLFEGAMQKQSKSLNGMLSTLKDTVMLGLKDIVMNSGFLDMVKGLVEYLIPKLEEGFAKVTRLFGVIGNLIQDVKGVLNGQDLSSEITEAFTFFTNGNEEQATRLKDIFLAVVNVLKKFGDWVSDNQETIITFLKGLAIAFGALLVIGTIVALIGALTNPLVLVAGAIALLYTAWQTNFLGLRDITTQVVNEVVSFFNEYLLPVIKLVVEWFREHWGEISLILKGYWEYMKGVIQIAWSIIYGIIKVGLAILSGDWGKAWEAIKEMVAGVWEGLKKIFNGAIDWIKGWGGMLFDNLTKPFRDAWSTIEGIINKIKDALDFTKRHSPSVLDIVQRGVGLVNNALGELDGGFVGMPKTQVAMAVAGAPSGGGVMASINISLDGAVIADEVGASYIGEKLGDSIIKRLQQNVRF